MRKVGSMSILAVVMFAAAVFLNGATDAVNSVTGAVFGGEMSIGRASLIAAVCEFAGGVVSARFFPGVMGTVEELADIPHKYGAAAATTVLASVAVWSAVAWLIGVPTSEGHGVMAAMTGTSVALCGYTGVGAGQWIEVLSGLALSVAAGAVAGALLRITLFKANNGKERKGTFITLAGKKRFLRLGLCFSAFLHGAQDFQKFLALMYASGLFIKGDSVCVYIGSALLFCGTLCSGSRIVEKTGRTLADLDTDSAVCADLASFLILLSATLAGVPVSTTCVKVSAATGSGRIAGLITEKKGVAAWCNHSKGCKKSSSLTAFLTVSAMWLLTFPVCFLLAFFITKLLII